VQIFVISYHIVSSATSLQLEVVILRLCSYSMLVGLYGLGSVILHLQYCSEPGFYEAVEWFFIPAGCLLAVLICLCCSVSKVRYQRPYPFIRKACCFLTTVVILCKQFCVVILCSLRNGYLLAVWGLVTESVSSLYNMHALLSGF